MKNILKVFVGFLAFVVTSCIAIAAIGLIFISVSNFKWILLCASVAGCIYGCYLIGDAVYDEIEYRRRFK